MIANGYQRYRVSSPKLKPSVLSVLRLLRQLGLPRISVAPSTSIMRQDYFEPPHIARTFDYWLNRPGQSKNYTQSCSLSSGTIPAHRSYMSHFKSRQSCWQRIFGIKVSTPGRFMLGWRRRLRQNCKTSLCNARI